MGCRGVFSLAVGTFKDHVGLQEGPLEENTLQAKSTVAGSNHFFSPHLGGGEVVVSIHKDLWFNDGHKSIVLADGSVTRKSMGGFLNGVRGRSLSRKNLHHGTPFGKSSAEFVVFLAAKVEISQTLGVELAIGSRKRTGTLVNFDTEDHTLFLETVNKIGSVWHLLEKGFLEKDHPANVLSKSRGGSKQVAVRPAVVTIVLNTDALEAFSDRASRFISGENSLSRRGDGIRSRDEFLSIFPLLGENVAADSLKALLCGLGVSHCFVMRCV
mmetsp:Transcript_7522/g.14701  ORF Transcript_7522/g.14701 Transcript_7522/m.14701 type:complete len:270 (+) Transcript_7522:668-1477(+)